MRGARIFLLTAILLCACAVRAQQPDARDERGRAEQPRNGTSAQKGKDRDNWRGGDLAADNLDRVAATAEQISEVLNRDPGLMVELKRALAEDAGAGGQLLEESDLSNAAIAEKLREELRTRVLATRLLQRYGYLLPKLNPDSELAQEQKIFLQVRAQQLMQAGERNYEQPWESSAERTAGCRSNEQSDCESLNGLPEQIRGRSNGRGTNNSPAGQEPQDDENAPNARPENSNFPSLQRTETTEPGSAETLLASTSQMGSGGNSSSNRGATRGSTEGSFPSMLGANDDPWGRGNVGDRTGNPGGMPATPRDFERRSGARGAADGTLADLEPVHMVHRASPYAEAPSLYDLYVQAAAPTQPTKRFGMDVFRHSGVNSDVLPMDLPVGADYILGPGDSLSIELWGGVSQRLFRTVDREGRLLLPEAGPLLVSGKSLGEVQDAVQRLLRTEFRNVSADVSLLKLRTVRVYVVGEVAAPGAYDVSSLSTPLNALFAAGGITARGSLRRLEHYRGQQLLEEVDAYDLLLHGVRRDVKRLENGDSLRVPPVGAAVTVEGMVRRPALYELRGEKNLNEVLELAGGILPAAALHHIEVQRLDAHEKRTMLSLDIGEGSEKEALRAAFEKFSVQDGDEIHIFPIAPYNTSAVYLEGHVLRPGRYSYHEGMKLTDLIPSYKELSAGTLGALWRNHPHRGSREPPGGGELQRCSSDGASRERTEAPAAGHGAHFRTVRIRSRADIHDSR